MPPTPITITDYIELAAPLAEAETLLHDESLWSQLPIKAERNGTFWHYQGDLYAINPVPMPPCPDPHQRQMAWQISNLGASHTPIQITITLYDAVLVCHAAVAVTFTLHPTFPVPGIRLWHRWNLTQHVRRYCSALVNRVRERRLPQTVAPVSFGLGEADAATLADALRPYYPQTIAAFEQMHALDHLERIWKLERGWQHILNGEYDPTIYAIEPNRPTPAILDFDLIYAGGGLGLLHAVVMARCYGWRVMLFDRGEVGCVHREWNISRDELAALVQLGIVTWAELAPVIMREYRDGVVRFAASPHSPIPEYELWLPTVLNVALDAGALLRLMRRKLLEAGGTILDNHTFRRVTVCTTRRQQIASIAVELAPQHSSHSEVWHARLLLDGMGSTSPLALLRHAGTPFAGVCPTVGTVARGFEPGRTRTSVDPTLGDILVSVADTQGNRQMIWEGFPGRDDELTVYLFYYAALTEGGRTRRKPADLFPLAPLPLDAPDYSLLELFEAYFALLPSYKQPAADFGHIKPVYGYIPGRHSLSRHDAPLLAGVLPVGDAAAQQSPLTFCGFGSHVRNVGRTTSLLDYALRHDLTSPRHLQRVTAFQVNVSLNWVFSRFMQPWSRPHHVNELQNAFLATLDSLGSDLATRFFQDRMRWHDYNQVVWYTMERYPNVFLIAFPVLGIPGVWQWFCDYVRFSLAAATAHTAHRAGASIEAALLRVSDQYAAELGLRVRAAYAEWRTMGWLDE
ncbi:MAG: hypothetical protein HC911_10360 [Chloroflexaceae bacterium]|nr:hypothetical protein [Chloroflexaceae bacterium]